MILEAKHVRKEFGHTIALDDAYVRLQSGEVTALVGENGAGKSTLLKAIAGVHHMDLGEIQIDGRPVEIRSMSDAYANGISIVFQESTINPFITIAENIFIDRLHEYARPVTGIDWKRITKDAQEILDSMESGIDAKADINSLNFGQWKLIEVARALSYDPKVLLLDESTAFLNHNETVSFVSSVKKLRSNGLAIGFVSHHMQEIYELADRITVMRDGHFIVEMSGYYTSPHSANFSNPPTRFIYSLAILTICEYGFPSTVSSPIAHESSTGSPVFCTLSHAYILTETSALDKSLP